MRTAQKAGVVIIRTFVVIGGSVKVINSTNEITVNASGKSFPQKVFWKWEVSSIKSEISIQLHYEPYTYAYGVESLFKLYVEITKVSYK